MGSEKLAPILSHERNRSMQTLMTSSKDQFRKNSIDESVSKKLFGKLSVADVARAQDRSYNGSLGIDGYEIKPNQRFNFNRNHMVP